MKLFKLLNQRHGISEEAFDQAFQYHLERGGTLGEALIEKKLVSETELLETFSELYHLPFWPTLPLEKIRSDHPDQVPLQFLKRFSMVPLGPESNGEKAGSETQADDDQRRCAIAIHSPESFQAMDDLVRLLELKEFEIVFSKRSEILSAINMSYEFSPDSAEQIVQDMEESGPTIIRELEESADLLDDTSDAPIIKLVNHIISKSIKARASDIHIEPYQNRFKVRYRVDGILYDLLNPPKRFEASLISRIKVMSKLNIAEKRLPQDGRFEVRVGDQQIDVRVSTIPTSFGERVVLRLLNKTASVFGFPELGLSPERLEQLKQLVTSPNGIILVTGPTGSGKTTTLYAVLSSINHPDINIITIEDPVEYQLAGISQIQVNPKIELTFARGLRSIVRQDPDVILVGEIRDHETAEIAVQSALTGHLVFSTLHTNDSASAITRLVDIGVEPFLISSSVIAVIAQRLVRVLCPRCKEPYRPADAVLQTLGISPEEISERSIHRAKGCDHCIQTGFKGRIGIFEIMIMNESIKNMILRSFDSNMIKAQSVKDGMVTLRQDGIRKVLSGVTTIEEVLRVA